MTDKIFNGLQFPNKSSGQARTSDSGFFRVYVKNKNLYAVDDAGTDKQLTGISETDPVFMNSAASGITSTNISNWNTAYGWGDHSQQSYLSSSDIGVNTLAYSSNLQSFVDVFTLPTTDGTSGQVLSTDGSGNLTFVNNGAEIDGGDANSTYE